MLFRDRTEAGQRLAERLRQYRGANATAFGLARGGVIVAAEVARALDLPLEVMITQKIGAPGNPEYGIGAVAEGGEVVLNDSDIRLFGISQHYLDQEIAYQEGRIRRRQELYRDGRSLPDVHGKTTIVVDDGIATGYTMRAAIKALRRAGAERIVVAVPVGPAETIAALRQDADDVACLATPEPFLAVGRFYSDFEQVSDDEVVRALAEASPRSAAGGMTGGW